MKMKNSLLITVLFLSITGAAFAQADTKCMEIGSLFIEPAKAKSYDSALPHYDNLVKECPSFSMATYQLGAKMFAHFIEQGDKSKIANLEQCYMDRLKYFPNKSKEGDILSRIAQVKYDNKIGTKETQFADFDKAYKKDAASFKSPKSLYTYFSLAVDLNSAGKLDIQEVFDLYDIVYAKIETEEIQLASKITPLIEKQEAGTTLSSRDSKYLKRYEKNLKAYGKVKGSVDGKLGKLADCPNLIPLYTRDFEANKNNIAWVRRAASRLNAKNCDDPLFFQLVQQLHSLEPSAKSAFYLGRLADQKGDRGEALKYYNQSAELETNPSDKAKVYYRIAENFRKKGSYGQARKYYNKALSNKPSMGGCYLKIAQMYAKSANDCGTTVFEKRAINWLAADLATKAARVDASISKTAKAAAESYRQRAPSKSDIFSEGMQGKTITFSCWVGGSVTVPSL